MARRKVKGKWIVALYVDGICIKAARVNRLSWCRRWANQRRADWAGIKVPVKVIIRRYDRRKWKPEDPWKKAAEWRAMGTSVLATLGFLRRRLASELAVPPELMR